MIFNDLSYNLTLDLSTTVLLTALGFAILLLSLPVIRKYVAVINTMIHEAGHAVASKLTGGEVVKINLRMNTEGTAWSRNGYLGGIIVSAAGYPAASLFAFSMLLLFKHGLIMTAAVAYLAIIVGMGILWVRNLYGIIWVTSITLSMVALFLADQYYNWDAMPYMLLVVVMIVLVQSVVSAFHIMLISFKTPRNAGDASSLARAVKIIPPQAFGVLFFLQSIIFLILSIRLFI